jgi:hypothetical protein
MPIHLNQTNLNSNQNNLLLNPNPINTAAATANNNNSNNNNTLDLMDDRFSVVSDSAAWSTDLITNSDSDFESNSPSKYTPYSTYSSYSNNTNNLLNNQSLLSELNSVSQQQLNALVNTNHNSMPNFSLPLNSALNNNHNYNPNVKIEFKIL